MPSQGFIRYLLLAALLLGAGPAALAATDDDEEEPEAWDARWMIALSTEVDQQSNRNIEADAGYAWTPTTSVRVAANSVAYSEVPGNGFHAQGVELGAQHDFKRWSLSGAIARWQDSDVVTVEEGKLGADLRLKPWIFGVSAMLRRSGFDATKDNTTVTLPDGTQLAVKATSSCKMNNEGYGVHGAYAGDIWGGHAELRSFQYKNASCSFGTATGLDALTHPTRAEFVQLEAALVTELKTVGVRRIGRDNALLANALEVGASWKHQDFVVRLDFERQKDYFSGNSSDTLFATGTADMGHGSGVDLVVGLTRGSTVVQGAFVGFAVRAHF
jgi:hypothetical protein